ncbi:MAG: indole-3-glycerol-phosphate synthase [Candidatus Dormibacteria bacterium]
MTSDLGALQPIAARKQQEAEALQCAAAAMWAKTQSLSPARDLHAALRRGAVIAEMKRRSPSGGALRDDIDPAQLGAAYTRAGAAAISVLTDGPDFGGSHDDVGAARAATELPLLRKDFTVAPVQVAEARVAGADWVLLIAALLDDTALAECTAAVARARAHAIVEVHDEAELERALGSGAECIGVNNRDLRTLRTDLDTFTRLRARIPDGVTCIAESGVREPQDAARLVREGADGVLVGEALMRASSPETLCAAIVESARAAAQ